MTTTIKHRGPDDVGFLLRENVGFGHRRLSIIDLSPTGHQPMGSADGRIQMVFNGEIYNFLELKKDLIAKGYAFRGGSDSEVIITLYQEYGTESFCRLNGMFAIALYDFKDRELVLVRDRLGKKPLYYSQIGGVFLFGSELKVLLEHPAFVKKLNLAAVNTYFACDYIPTPATIFEGVFKLEPGTYLSLKSGHIQKYKFWDISFDADPEAVRLSKEGKVNEIFSALDARLESAVHKRLMADVPLGVFLSGGIDSSTVAYYAQKNSVQKIKTFCIGFKDQSYDESSYARQVAKFLGTEHHEAILEPKECLELIPRLADLSDEPVADYSFIPTYLLSRFTRQHVTVALGGDGGDELFFGYGTIVAERIAQAVRFFPVATDIGLMLLGMLPVSHARFNTRFKLERFLAGLNSPKLYRHQAWLGTFDASERNKLFTRQAQQQLASTNGYTHLDNYGITTKNFHRFNELIYLYLRTYLMDQVLVKVDRASMANSLEVRAPFLDYEFVDFVNSLSYTYKIKGLQTKWLLRKLMHGKLPPEIIRRPKAGFGIPLSDWLSAELKPLMLELLAPENLRPTGLFNPDYTQGIIAQHLERRKDCRKELWNLITFQLWAKKWLI